jgi:ferredoxin
MTILRHERKGFKNVEPDRWSHLNCQGENRVSEKVPEIDEKGCIACGACEEICPEVFRSDKSLGFALVMNPTGADEAKIEEVIEACPVHCIFWPED